jgi:hypothetical protein
MYLMLLFTAYALGYCSNYSLGESYKLSCEYDQGFYSLITYVYNNDNCSGEEVFSDVDSGYPSTCTSGGGLRFKYLCSLETQPWSGYDTSKKGYWLERYLLHICSSLSVLYSLCSLHIFIYIFRFCSYYDTLEKCQSSDASTAPVNFAVYPDKCIGGIKLDTCSAAGITANLYEDYLCQDFLEKISVGFENCNSKNDDAMYGYGYGDDTVTYDSSRCVYSTSSDDPTAAPSAPPANGAAPSTLKSTNVFTYQGYVENITVPEGVRALHVYMWGASGGMAGGNGAYVEGLLPVSAGQQLKVIVGQAGSLGGSRAFGGGGYGMFGGGGGRSAIQIENEDVVTAGGGGGNFGGHATSYMNGAIQNVSNRGDNIAMTTEALCDYGGGGSVTAGGQAATCLADAQPGSKYQGGDTPLYVKGINGGGGGGGYYGGGAGHLGGGGGSSYLYNLISYHMSGTSLEFGICAGTHSKYYSTCSSSCGTYDTEYGYVQNGCVVIELVYSNKQLHRMQRCDASLLGAGAGVHLQSHS